MRVNCFLIGMFFSLLIFNEAVLAEKPLAPEKLQGAIRVGAEETVELIINTKNLVIVDSRKETEYLKGHIQGSVNLLDTKMTFEMLGKYVPDKSTPLLFYCNGERCLRSLRAATKALDWGYKKVYWFRGGWSEWVNKGMPINR